MSSQGSALKITCLSRHAVLILAAGHRIDKDNLRWISATGGIGRGSRRGLCKEFMLATVGGADPAIYRSVNDSMQRSVSRDSEPQSNNGVMTLAGKENHIVG
jgi:hypothetical protein